MYAGTIETPCCLRNDVTRTTDSADGTGSARPAEASDR